jgi:hypothetical protein
MVYYYCSTISPLTPCCDHPGIGRGVDFAVAPCFTRDDGMSPFIPEGKQL